MGCIKYTNLCIHGTSAVPVGSMYFSHVRVAWLSVNKVLFLRFEGSKLIQMKGLNNKYSEIRGHSAEKEARNPVRPGWNIRIVSQKRILKLCKIGKLYRKIGKLNPLTWKSRAHYHKICGGAPSFRVYQPGVAYHSDMGWSPPKSGLQLDGLRK